MTSTLRIFLSVSIFFGMLLEAAFGVTVSGKLTVKTEPVAAIQVFAYPADAPSLAGDTPHRSNVSGKDGLFSIDLPPGAYYFIARGKELYSYYGRNPVTVPREGLGQMNLSLVPLRPAPPRAEPQVATGILGQTTVDGVPLAGAIVYVYTDLTNELKGMGLGMAGPTTEQGLFEAPLPAGTYYVIARMRRSKEFAGPLRAGDYIGFYPENPVKLAEGEVLKIAIPMLEVPEKVERLADSLFGQTSIHGRVLDKKGAPVAGVRVFLYEDSQMLNRPLHVSQTTGPDGAFVLSFANGGVYYLAARNTLGGAPAPGELFGTYDGTPSHSVRVQTGKALKGIEIVVEEMW
ncbi:hypothetical protein DESUT3_30110 [Desulfuromonas versatilis]|uniref:Carboxypeptidase regulatory-like domain-containing protein n=1 Tax=Desulfuromonas versatilis TaxID=2802975 RepID=A0ABM8HUD5_9BACT|nr:carboxypeptidase-like regulatory domain-containing protein [Desulfuromonas versatilis]BCR05942.1 hypothetical protein DESUT3_30110 [Desulfuromonas versatilis]